MADEPGPAVGKGGIPQQVVKMRVGIDDVTDWQGGKRRDCGPQRPPGRRAAAGINHRRTTLTDHHAQIGAVAARRVVDRHVLALMHEHAVSHRL